MKEIKLTLSIEETNTILDSLGNLPFNKVYALIGKIQEQAGSQLNTNGKQQTPAPEKAAKT